MAPDGNNEDDNNEDDDSDDDESMLSPRSQADRIVSPRRVQPRIRALTGGIIGDKHLEDHRRARKADGDVRQTLISGLKKNRFCSHLSGASLQTIVQHMECFEFSASENVVKQGDAGNYFFVIDYGEFEVSIDGKPVDKVGRGASFGGIALLYKSPRTATVTAVGAGCVWGVDSATFRHVLRDHAKLHYMENRKVLDQISLFDGLCAQKKERVGKLALFEEVYEPGVVVIRHGACPASVYAIKSGKLVVKSRKGVKLQELQTGDAFGWRAVLYNEQEANNVIVTEKCQLVGIGVKQLRKALGEDLAYCLMTSFVVSAMQKSPVFSRLPASHVVKIADMVETRQYAAADRFQEQPVFSLVVDGEVTKVVHGETVTFRRGQFCPGDELRTMHEEAGGALPSTYRTSLRAVDCTTGPSGCRLAVLTKEGMLKALKELRLSVCPDDDSGLDYIMKVMVVKKVPVFHELSDEQVDGLVNSLVCKSFEKHIEVFKQGDPGDDVYIILHGKVEVIVDGTKIRELGPGASFGERALLVDECRSATVKVLDSDAEFWTVDKQAFRSAIPEGMRAKLVQSHNYQRTSVCLKDLKHVRFIGAGAFGTVRLVEHKRTALRYALKRIRKKQGQVPSEVTRECELLAENHHPFTLHFVDTFTTEKSIYILTELVTGGQLHEQVLGKMGVLSRKHAQFYIGSLALTLECIHGRGVVFRDLKPENVMLDSQGYIKLVDFGLAKKLDPSTLHTYTVAGTLMYMAPEVIHGGGYGTECDIWSLGVMLFEFVTGDLPFGGEAENEQQVLESIIYDSLEFPGRYADAAGKKLMQGLINREKYSRLGAGAKGWQDIKEHKFFKQGINGNLFSKISGRELTAPLVPECDKYTDEAELKETGQASTSDNEEFGIDEPMDVGCRLLLTFNKFDLNGDGTIDREELGTVLGALDPDSFDREACNEIFSHIDRQKAGAVSYDDFVAWVVGDQTPKLLKSALRGSFNLDARS